MIACLVVIILLITFKILQRNFRIMKALNKDAINKISSGQVITCILDAIKELIENSLDAGAKTIKIKIEDQGLKLISVSDDGSGITQNGRETCGHEYTTSKIVDFEDLRNELATYGFRGEAIHSLCVVGNVIITTRCRNEKSAVKMTFNHDGDIVKKEDVTSNFGTTVSIQDILSDYPVRVREERIRFSADNLKNLLSKYYLAAPTVRFVVDAQPYLNTTRPPLSDLLQAIKYEFGSEVASNLIEKTAENFVGDIRIRIKAIVPSMNCDWKNASTSRMQPRQYLLVNGRPVKNSTIEKKINETYWKKYGSLPKRYARYVFCIDFFRETALCSSMFDVNKDPSKSNILFSQTEAILKLIDDILEFQQQKIKPKQIRQWPSREIKITSMNEVNENLASFGSNTWRDAGIFENFSLFNVVDFKNQNFIVAIITSVLIEICGVSRVEFGRTENSELIVNFWEQLIERHSTSPCIFILGKIN